VVRREATRAFEIVSKEAIVAPKILVVISLLALPPSLFLWRQSHTAAEWHRYDLTIYKSLWIYLKDGRCGLEILTMPTKTGGRSEFHTPMTNYNPLANRGSFLLTTKKQGPYRVTWIVFPLWAPVLCWTMGCAAPLIRPTRRWYRRRRGLCVECGYNLHANLTGRCPECGLRLRPTARQRLASKHA
jgi:hypothetical protein